MFYTYYRCKQAMPVDEFIRELMQKVTVLAETSPVAKIYLPYINLMLAKQNFSGCDAEGTPLLERRYVSHPHLTREPYGFSLRKDQLDNAVAKLDKLKTDKKKYSEELEQAEEQLDEIVAKIAASSDKEILKRLYEVKASQLRLIENTRQLIAHFDDGIVKEHNKVNAAALLCYFALHKHMHLLLSAVTSYDKKFTIVDALKRNFEFFKTIPNFDRSILGWVVHLDLSLIANIEKRVTETSYLEHLSFSDLRNLMLDLQYNCNDNNRSKQDRGMQTMLAMLP